MRFSIHPLIEAAPLPPFFPCALTHRRFALQLIGVAEALFTLVDVEGVMQAEARAFQRPAICAHSHVFQHRRHAAGVVKGELPFMEAQHPADVGDAYEAVEGLGEEGLLLAA